MIFSWQEIEHHGWGNLLLGNGFSIGVSQKFDYNSLLEIIDNHNINMYPHARTLFNKDKIGTNNFEEVLRVIYHAYLVNFYNLEAIRGLYENVRKSLIASVQIGHVDYKDVNRTKIREELIKYKSIFTTNYDLIVYWSITENWFEGFGDFFWNKGTTFDISNTYIAGKTPIFYLHGALHLKTQPNGNTLKVTGSDESSIMEILNDGDLGDIPLFISEGTPEMKLRRIRENDYLNFCYRSLLKTKGNLVIYGHGLNNKYDNHIIDAIRNSQVNKIAISIFSGLTQFQKNYFKSYVEEKFSDEKKEIYFFESDSHPLSQ